ncbi:MULTISPECIES: hypothetical protein [Cupriavidus]|uniref:Transmembrane protein n=1 Tax=Cupriavidus pinatubonensis (strain JMP 134 / LMG 1197) TaxID=264198 RepID=Q46R46_CUPPJ|nr:MULTISPECIES: hypothetical protein [Cupriavidus]QYY27961.1 hypothetical protein K2O51_08535 [Cupriavidus pinatubonensis]
MDPSATLTTASAQWASWWPWLLIAALGLFHGINPAMGWLFAVALGLHRHKRSVVMLSLLPIALGHALAVAVFVAVALWLGSVIDTRVFARAGGLVLIGWAAWHVWRGHRGRPRVGMQAGMAGLACWSFLMAGVHGAGLMLVPVLMPLCASPLSGQISRGSAVAPAVLALGLHTGAMLVAICAVALLVYDRIGVAFLRTGWINLDLVWSAALVLCGVALLLR